MRRHPRLLVGCLVLALALLLAGCGGNPKPKTLPSPSPSPSPSASPTASATPPVMPAAAKEKTKAGAQALVRYFVSALNFSGPAGDTKFLRTSYVNTCTRCESLADSIDKTYADGGMYSGGEWAITALKAYAIDQDVAYIDATVDYAPQVWVKRSGGKAVKYSASSNHLHAFQLRWTSAKGWRVGALDPEL